VYTYPSAKYHSQKAIAIKVIFST